MATTTKKSSDINQSLMLIGVLLIIVGVAASYMQGVTQLRTARQSYESAVAKDKGLDADIASLKDAQAALTKATASFATYNVDSSKASQAFPGNEDMPGLYIQMEYLKAVGTSLGLYKVDYQLSKPVADGTASRVPVAINLVGQYSGLRSYIDTLETNIRPLTITSLVLSPSTQKDTAGHDIPGFSLNLIGYVRGGALSAQYSASATGTTGQ